ncbi:L,D-transpeptidase family protein [Lichenicoccus sp.]|uniref:L,D-transpeptidase family protein n=1 Tax=Lichenicoccus sp. TaxID=2781899 RepID=UPI003D14E61D
MLGRSIGALSFGPRRVPCVLGAGGISLHKQEGDETTPAGLHRLRRVLYRADRLGAPPDCSLPREPIAPGDGWCDDVTHRDYNRPVRLPHDGRHERLWRNDGLYDLMAVLAYNDDPPQRGLGSAIFLHVAQADEAPTAGCVAVSLPDLRWLLQTGLEAIEVPPG